MKVQPRPRHAMPCSKCCSAGRDAGGPMLFQDWHRGSLQAFPSKPGQAKPGQAKPSQAQPSPAQPQVESTSSALRCWTVERGLSVQKRPRQVCRTRHDTGRTWHCHGAALAESAPVERLGGSVSPACASTWAVSVVMLIDWQRSVHLDCRIGSLPGTCPVRAYHYDQAHQLTRMCAFLANGQLLGTCDPGGHGSLNSSQKQSDCKLIPSSVTAAKCHTMLWCIQTSSAPCLHHLATALLQAPL
jgi:hypothetical protein